MSACPICLEEVDPTDALPWPGCGHPMHAICALNHAQYDIRCPICRFNLPIEKRRFQLEDVVSIVMHQHLAAPAHVHTLPVLATVIDDRGEDGAPEVVDGRHRIERRRRIIRAHEDLRILSAHVQDETRTLREIQARLQRMWSLRARATLRSLYATDEDIVQLRLEYRRCRQRLWRRRRQLDQRVAAIDV